MSGIYIHIPFCRQACTYCDFHFSTSGKEIDALVSSIEKEIILRKNYLGAESIETIYFGGGTPSLIDTQLIGRLLQAINREFSVDQRAEVTLEANPDDLTEEKLDALMNVGINRLSIGIQSFSDDDLRFMNRAHDSKQALTVTDKAKKSGFNNISIDLIYGIPGTTIGHWKKNLDIALSLDVDHLSCYALTIEPRTVLADMIRKKKGVAPDDERTIEDFELLMKRAMENGYEHYEISNFARHQKYSRHNTSYWQRKKYLGAGPSAHSYDGVSRQWNISNNIQYIRGVEKENMLFEKEELSESNRFNEYVLTSLRTMWGIDLSLISDEFGIQRKENFLLEMDPFIRKGMITMSGKNFVLTHEGKFFADRIAAELFVD